MRAHTWNDVDIDLADDWLFLDLASMATAGDTDDDRFERWLASTSRSELDTFSNLVGESADHTRGWTR